jgi:hypothetical protein
VGRHSFSLFLSCPFIRRRKWPNRAPIYSFLVWAICPSYLVMVLD